MDYAGVHRLGLTLTNRPAVKIRDITVTNALMTLTSGQDLLLWFAEVPSALLAGMHYYELFQLAEELTDSFRDPTILSWLEVPIQCFSWSRVMAEIMAMNASVAQARQSVRMTLDETGAQVQAETMLACTGAPSWNEWVGHTFGAQHPVVMWLTAPSSRTPFAVIATTSKAWLSPDQEGAC